MKSGQSSLLVFLCCLLKSYYCYLSDEEIYAFFIPRNTSVFGSEHMGKHIYPVTNELKCEQFQVSRVFLHSGCCQKGVMAVCFQHKSGCWSLSKRLAALDNSLGT